mgnify:CR=1 FL=1
MNKKEFGLFAMAIMVVLWWSWVIKPEVKMVERITEEQYNIEQREKES